MDNTNPRTPSGAADLPWHGLPPAEVVIDEPLVQNLLAAQHPDLARLPLQTVGEGWDNAVFRLGDDLAVRMPRRGSAAGLILQEQRWLPGLAKQLPLPIPCPCRVGQPGLRYPWYWSVVPWLKGDTADQNPPDSNQAVVFGRFLRLLHVPAPPDAPHNPFRGVHLRSRAESMLVRLERLAARTDLVTKDLLSAWTEALDAPVEERPTWIHGDLHPRNILVDQKSITGVIDWGDLCKGDPATDLASAWTLFPDPSMRQALWQSYGHISEALARRARGWAVLFGVMLLDTGLANHPASAAIGTCILRNVTERRTD